MIKIEFWLKKLDTNQESLEYITISVPKISNTVKPSGRNYYVCEVYSSASKAKNYPIYGINPADALWLASEFTRTHLQVLVKRGCTISEVESKEPWRLEKLSDDYLQEKLSKIKNNQDISTEEREKILSIIKESFGGSDSPIKDQINKLI